MVKLLGFAIAVFLFSFSSVCAQTLSEIEAKFGSPTSSYSVSEHVWMTPEFTTDGQLCRAMLYPKKFDASNTYVTSDLSLAEVEAIFDRLVPERVRGEKKENYGLAVTSGMVFAAFGYESVRINFVASLSSWSNIANKRETQEFPGIRSAQIATITWLNRACVSN